MIVMLSLIHYYCYLLSHLRFLPHLSCGVQLRFFVSGWRDRWARLQYSRWELIWFLCQITRWMSCKFSLVLISRFFPWTMCFLKNRIGTVRKWLIYCWIGWSTVWGLWLLSFSDGTASQRYGGGTRNPGWSCVPSADGPWARRSATNGGGASWPNLCGRAWGTLSFHISSVLFRVKKSNFLGDWNWFGEIYVVLRVLSMLRLLSPMRHGDGVGEGKLPVEKISGGAHQGSLMCIMRVSGRALNEGGNQTRESGAIKTEVFITWRGWGILSQN